MSKIRFLLTAGMRTSSSFPTSLYRLLPILLFALAGYIGSQYLFADGANFVCNSTQSCPSCTYTQDNYCCDHSGRSYPVCAQGNGTCTNSFGWRCQGDEYDATCVAGSGCDGFPTGYGCLQVLYNPGCPIIFLP